MVISVQKSIDKYINQDAQIYDYRHLDRRKQIFKNTDIKSIWIKKKNFSQLFPFKGNSNTRVGQ